MTRSSEHNGAFLKRVFVLFLISYSIVKSRDLFYVIDDLGFHIDMIILVILGRSRVAAKI